MPLTRACAVLEGESRAFGPFGPHFFRKIIKGIFHTVWLVLKNKTYRTTLWLSLKKKFDKMRCLKVAKLLPLTIAIGKKMDEKSA